VAWLRVEGAVALKQIVKRLRSLISPVSKRERDDFRDLIVDAIGEVKRQHLRKSWRAGFRKGIQRTALQRKIVTQARKTTTKLRRRERIPFPRQIWLLRKFRPSPILDSVWPQRTSAWVDPAARIKSNDSAAPAVELRNFSFLDHPRETLESLRQIAIMEAQERSARIDFSDLTCADVSSYMILAEFWHEMLPVFNGGRMEIHVQKVLVSVGLAQALGIRVEGIQNLDDVWAFPLMRRRARGTSSSTDRYRDRQTREVVSDQFCDAMNLWLGRAEIGRQLNDEGRGWIKNIIGEILENAERHSDGERRDGSWSIAGFMTRDDNDEGERSFRCHLGFINLGDTFSRSLARGTPDTVQRIQSYVRRCHAQGCKLSSETLWTLCAIQDGITSVRDADLQDRGGYGLQEMLDMVSILGHSTRAAWSPKVTILSGSSCIMVREPYTRGLRAAQDEPRTLWFNEENTADLPPDERYVFDLNVRFPGSLISVQFVLDPEFLRGKSDGRDIA